MKPWIISLTLMGSFLTAPAQARLGEVVCDDTARLEQQITGINAAQKRAQAMRGPDALIEVWIEPRSGDWTLVQTYPNGTSCIVAMGENWETLQSGDDPA